MLEHGEPSRINVETRHVDEAQHVVEQRCDLRRHQRLDLARGKAHAFLRHAMVEGDCSHNKSSDAFPALAGPRGMGRDQRRACMIDDAAGEQAGGRIALPASPALHVRREPGLGHIPEVIRLVVLMYVRYPLSTRFPPFAPKV
jgi:hypothetical protein